MKELWIQNYIDKITKEDIIWFAKNNNIILQNNEVNILYQTLKKDWKVFLYGDPSSIWKELELKLSAENFEKGMNLFRVMKQKYQSFL